MDELVSQNPFPGPQPYRASDRSRFFGREDLSYRLENVVVANNASALFNPRAAEPGIPPARNADRKRAPP